MCHKTNLNRISLKQLILSNFSALLDENQLQTKALGNLPISVDDKIWGRTTRFGGKGLGFALRVGGKVHQLNVQVH